MSDKPNAADAQVILQLYDLRREAEMRKARHWWAASFFPRNADDFLKVAWSVGTQENNWLRQVAGYWAMAAGLVLHGAINQELFLDPGVSGEMFLIYAKVHPFIEDLRQKLHDPQAFLNIEKVVTGSEWGRNRLQFMLERVEAMRQKVAEQKSSR